jgi:hypothetical protein
MDFLSLGLPDIRVPRWPLALLLGPIPGLLPPLAGVAVPPRAGELRATNHASGSPPRATTAAAVIIPKSHSPGTAKGNSSRPTAACG